jgi:hypothetical protein
MAKISGNLEPAVIRRLAGLIDLYSDKRTGNIARSWPRMHRPTPTAKWVSSVGKMLYANLLLQLNTTQDRTAWAALAPDPELTWTDRFKKTAIPLINSPPSMAIGSSIWYDPPAFQYYEQFALIQNLNPTYASPSNPAWMAAWLIATTKDNPKLPILVPHYSTKVCAKPTKKPPIVGYTLNPNIYQIYHPGNYTAPNNWQIFLQQAHKPPSRSPHHVWWVWVKTLPSGLYWPLSGQFDAPFIPPPY